MFEMKNYLNSETHQKFYQNLGKLFYAIAAADRVVRKEEVDSLKKVVKEEWLKEDNIKDDFGTDSVFQIEIVFDWMDANKPVAEEAFKRFEEFYHDHHSLYSKELKEKIINTCREIASAFRGNNKSELVMLAKLQTLFKNK